MYIVNHYKNVSKPTFNNNKILEKTRYRNLVGAGSLDLSVVAFGAHGFLKIINQYFRQRQRLLKTY